MTLRVCKGPMAIKSLLEQHFEKDDALIEFWHVAAGQGLHECVMRTLCDLIEAKVEVHEVLFGAQSVGYIGHEVCGGEHYLSGFFLAPKFRSYALRAQFWNIVLEHFEHKPFFVGLYKKNIPACRFIEKMGGEAAVTKSEMVLYKIGGIQCQ